MPRLQIRTLFEGKTNTIIETLDARLGEEICHTLKSKLCQIKTISYYKFKQS